MQKAFQHDLLRELELKDFISSILILVIPFPDTIDFSSTFVIARSLSRNLRESDSVCVLFIKSKAFRSAPRR